MADKEKYVIKIQGKLIEVSQDVYLAYYQLERQERWQEEKKQEHDVVSYDAKLSISNYNEPSYQAFFFL